VEAPRRLGLVISFADAIRNVAPSPFGGPWPAIIAITVTLERHAGIGRGTLL
jgi:glycine cleavage system pyridoxal-binding protein P